MTASRLSRIFKEIVVRAPRARVWRAMTTPEEFAKWFGVEMEGAFAPGNRVKMTSVLEGYEGEVVWVTIERMEPETLFSWRWHPGMVLPDVDYSKEPMTLVTFRLEDVEGVTRVTVEETGFDAISLARRARVYKENEDGWEYQMRSLARHVGEA
jgi:uncharacterized protein YndB with AHSA1/START domain